MLKALCCILCLLLPLEAAQFLTKGNDAYSAANYGAAISFYQQAIEAGENPTMAYFNLGNCYYQQDKIPRAIVAYRASLLEAPDFFKPYLNLGILYYNLEDFPAAAAVLERGRRLNPQNSQVLLLLASIYRELQKFSLAIPLTEQAFELDSSYYEALFLLYDMNVQLEDYGEAKRWLLQYPDSATRGGDKLQLLAELEERSKNFERAYYYYQKLIEKEPERKWAHYRLSLNLHREGNTLLALYHCEQALHRFPAFSELALLAGNLAFQSKMNRKAETYYRMAAEQGSSDGLVGLQNVLGAYELLGDAPGVKRIYTYLLSYH